MDSIDLPEPSVIGRQLREAGVSGAGGGGFPTYAKWEHIDQIDHLLINHQESEPNNFIDKWLGDRRAEELAALFQALVEGPLETVVIGAKLTDRERVEPLETATDATVRFPDELPVDADAESGTVVAYTDDTYEYGMENVLLHVATDTILGKDLPVDYGWIVQNTETTVNIHDALAAGEPVTHKLVHVDGFRTDGSRITRRLLRVPIGTPIAEVLAAADAAPATLADDRLIADGGPGWCFELDAPPTSVGIRKRTNCVLVLDRITAAENEYGDGRIDVRDEYDWTAGEQPTTPDGALTPDRVRIPLITNVTYDDVVVPSEPVVEPGDTVTAGQAVARHNPAGISPAHHAPFGGEVTKVTSRHVTIRRR